MTSEGNTKIGNSSNIAKRRRGAVLERAIFEATWEELREGGYGALTFDAVASRAGTSRPVLSRRWSTRPELVLAAIRYRLAAHPLDIPNLGDVREELISYLTQTVARGWPFAMMFASQMTEYFRETNTTPHQLRAAIATADENSIFEILHRAVQRGEVDGRKLTPRIVRLPKDMLFNDAMATMRPTPKEAIVEIVDEVILPLLKD